MSWRFLFVFLLLAAGAAAFGGVQVGDWLVAHAPVAAPSPNADSDDNVAVLDANGKPYTAQPPQPLVNGTLGVPADTTQPDWAITSPSLLRTNTNPDIHLSANKMSSDEIRALTQASAGLPPGPADVVSVDVPAPGQGSRTILNAPPMPASGQMPGTSPTDSNWQQALSNELAQCATLGFFERPSCAWGARNRYCEPNKAWGSVPGCPSRPR